MFTLEVVQKEIENDQANFPPVVRNKTGIGAGFAHDLLMTRPANGAGNNVERVSCNRIHPGLQRVAVLLGQVLVDFGAFTAEAAIGT